MPKKPIKQFAWFIVLLAALVIYGVVTTFLYISALRSNDAAREEARDRAVQVLMAEDRSQGTQLWTGSDTPTSVIKIENGKVFIDERLIAEDTETKKYQSASFSSSGDFVSLQYNDSDGPHLEIYNILFDTKEAVVGVEIVPSSTLKLAWLSGGRIRVAEQHDEKITVYVSEAAGSPHEVEKL